MRRIYLTEQQFANIMCNNVIDESWSIDSIKKYFIRMLIAGAITLPEVMSYISKNESIPEASKGAVYNEIKNSVDTAIHTPQWVLADDKTIVTVYNAKEEQCNNDPSHTASGFKINMDNPSSDRVAAVERTFMKELGLNYGDVIMIKGTHRGLFDGTYRVEDTMNKKYAGMHKIDLLVNDDITHGGTWDNTFAKVYVLKDKRQTENVISDLNDSYSEDCPD